MDSARAGVLGLLAAGAYVAAAPKVYTASTSVYVTATAANSSQVTGGRTSGAVDMDSEAQLVQSTNVATLARQMLRSNLTETQLRKKISVTVPANSQVLQIACHAPTPDAAATCANDFAKAFLQTQSTIRQISSRPRWPRCKAR